MGFPAASQTDFYFIREAVDQRLVPDDVTIEVLTQSRPELIERSFDSIRAPRHRPSLQLDLDLAAPRCFGLDRKGITEIAVSGARLIRDLAVAMPETEIVYQYSPESFTGTELDHAAEVRTAVLDVLAADAAEEGDPGNLPATVEMATPNIFADQIEWFGLAMPRSRPLHPQRRPA